ncbi:MAG: DUF4932 domain-containing protein [Armatimonadota bacterium]
MFKCPAYAGANGVKVTVDPRIELLSAVQLLSDYPHLTRYSFQYKQDMAAYFAPYKNHRAVVMFRRMSSTFFSYDAPPALMLYVSDPPGLQPHPDFQGNARRIATMHGGGPDGAKSTVEFVDALRDFARASNFQGFYVAHRDTYRRMIADVQSKLDGLDIVGPLEDYYGHARRLKYTIVLAPLFAGAYGPMVERADGVRELYDICGPQIRQFIGHGAALRAVAVPVFGNAEDIQDLAWHEMGHSFVNPLGEKHWNELARYSSLYDPISRAMQRQAYSNWRICVNEHLDRAVEARIIFKEKGRWASELFITAQRMRGFAYIRPLCRRLEDYEKHRDRYPTFQGFYPRLIEEFRSLQKQNLGRDFYRVTIAEQAWYYTLVTYQLWPKRFAAFLIIPPAVSAVWACRDAHKRKKRWWPVAILVLFGIWPLGLIVWLFIRRKRS